MDRIELNGHIERLVDTGGQDAEARRAVVEFALAMRGSSPFQFRGLYQRTGGKVSGETPEHGQVEVGDDRAEATEFSSGAVLERVGYYKIWRQKDWIHISHFWKAAVETASEVEQTQQWVLALNRREEAEWFGERGIRHLFTLRLTKLLNIDLSREMFEERWGPAVSKRHKGALVLAVTITA